jgi:hypothetical protein
MGTSTSSLGPGAGVSFDPPWLDQIETQPNSDGNIGDGAESPETDNAEQQSAEAEESSFQVAPPSRFGGARRSLGKFVREEGGRSAFSRAAGHYSQTGMGGAGRVASRMRHSTKTASNFAHFLGAASSGSDPVITQWVDSIVGQNLPSESIIDKIIRHVAPSGGSRDEESCSDSMAQAMSEFLDQNEEADLLSLGEADIREITELFIANEAYNRLMNDIGQIFERENISATEAVELGKEMHEYLTADISVQIESLWEISSNPTQVQLDQLLRDAIQNTFEIYEVEI